VVLHVPSECAPLSCTTLMRCGRLPAMPVLPARARSAPVTLPLRSLATAVAAQIDLRMRRRTSRFVLSRSVTCCHSREKCCLSVEMWSVRSSWLMRVVPRRERSRIRPLRLLFSSSDVERSRWNGAGSSGEAVAAAATTSKSA